MTIPRWRSCSFVLIALVACAGLRIVETPLKPVEGPLHPKVPGYALNGDVISGPSGPEYRFVVQTAMAGASTYEVKDLAGTLLLTMSCTHDGTVASCTNQFPTIDLGFSARSPNQPVTVLIGAFIAHGALSDGHADADGLGRFAAKTGVQLVSISAANAEMMHAMREDRCRSCDQDFRACQVDASRRRRNPPPGFSVSTSCEARYEECTQSNIGNTSCGPAPR